MASDLDALKQLKDSRDVMLKEVGKVIVGQEQIIEQLMMTLLGARALLARRCARLGQDALNLDDGADARSQIQPYSVHPRPDALGHHGYRNR